MSLADDPRRATALVRRVLMAAVGVSLGLALIGVLSAGWLVVALFGEAFEPAEAPARVLLAGLPAYTALGIAWYALLAVDGEGALMRLAVGAAIASIVGGLLLVPAKHDTGAAWVYVLTLAVLALGASPCCEGAYEELSPDPPPRRRRSPLPEGMKDRLRSRLRVNPSRVRLEAFVARAAASVPREETCSTRAPAKACTATTSPHQLRVRRLPAGRQAVRPGGLRLRPPLDPRPGRAL
jgi:hypothetical protein